MTTPGLSYSKSFCKLILILYNYFSDHFTKKSRDTFEMLDDRVDQMWKSITITPKELQKRIEKFEEEYSKATVNFFVKMKIKHNFIIQTHRQRLDLLWGIESSVRREFNYQKRMVSVGKRLVEETLLLSNDGKTRMLITMLVCFIFYLVASKTEFKVTVGDDFTMDFETFVDVVCKKDTAAMKQVIDWVSFYYTVQGTSLPFIFSYLVLSSTRVSKKREL